MEITVDEVRSLFEYHPDGFLVWKKHPSGLKEWDTRLAGKRAGNIDPLGYTRISINGRRYPAHSLIYLYHHGTMPACIDHINRSTLNVVDNLRPASTPENRWNSKMNKNNTSGFKGVHYDQKQKKYHSRIAVHGKRIFLGCFETAQEAHAAYAKASIKYHGTFAGDWK